MFLPISRGGNRGDLHFISSCKVQLNRFMVEEGLTPLLFLRANLLHRAHVGLAHCVFWLVNALLIGRIEKPLTLEAASRLYSSLEGIFLLYFHFRSLPKFLDRSQIYFCLLSL